MWNINYVLNILFFVTPVAHHICEQTPEQTEPGSHWAGVTGADSFPDQLNHQRFLDVCCCWCVLICASVCLLVKFADGVYLILLMGLLENYFVPLYNFFLTPESFEQKVLLSLLKYITVFENEFFFSEVKNMNNNSIVSPQVHNVAFAFELMQDGGLKKPKARPEGNHLSTHRNSY